MAKKKHRRNLGAPEAVTGYRFQFVWTARRCLQMIRPSSTLKQVVVEGLHPDDELNLGTGPEQFIGVDLSEYHGSVSLKDASRIVISQLKCGVKHPHVPWTVIRLCAAKKGLPKSSVIGRLAMAFSALIVRGALSPVDILAKVRVQLVTNRPIDRSAAALLAKAQSVIRGAKQPARLSFALLSAAGLSTNEIAELRALCRASSLSADVFLRFLLCWDLSTFCADSPAFQSVRLFQEIIETDRVGARTGLSLLCNMVEEAAQRTTDAVISRKDVLACLDTTEEDFYPAPMMIDAPGSLIKTKDVEGLAEILTSGQNLKVVAHGPAGIGKSVTAVSIERALPPGSKVIVYDCYGKGEASTPNKFRYPASTACTQIGNEISVACATDVYMFRNRLDRRSLWAGLQRSITVGAKALQAEGGLLVVLVDAADNAALACTGDIHPEREESFLRHLWNLDLPPNARLVMTCRSHRVGIIEAPEGAANFLLKGFSKGNSLVHLRTLMPSAPPGLGAQFHKATVGIPRLQYYWLRSLEPIPVAQATDQITRRDVYGLDEEYRDWLSAASTVLPPGVSQMLAAGVLVTSGGGTPVGAIADALGVDGSTIAHFLEGMSPGLTIDEDRIRFRDEDFESFLLTTVNENVRLQARGLLADSCLRCIDKSAYATIHAPEHLFAAARYKELIDLALRRSGVDRIEDLLKRAEHESARISLALKAANLLKDYQSAAHLMFELGRVRRAHGTSARMLTEYPEAAIRNGRYDSLDAACSDRLDRDSLGRMHFRIAAELSRTPVNAELARERLANGEAWLRSHIDEVGSQQWGRLSYDIDDSVYYALAGLQLSGVVAAENIIRRWTHGKNRLDAAYRFFAALARRDGIVAAIGVYHKMRGLGVVRAACAAGIVDAGGAISETDLRQTFVRVSRWVARHAVRHDVLGPWMISFVESCAKTGISRQDLLSCLKALPLDPPNMSSIFYASHSWSQKWDAHTRRVCLRRTLEGGSASARDIVGENAELWARLEKENAEYRSRYGSAPEKDTLTVLASLLPVYNRRATGIMAKSSAQTLGRGFTALAKGWRSGASDYWYKGQSFYRVFVSTTVDALVRSRGYAPTVVEALLLTAQDILKCSPQSLYEHVAGSLQARDEYRGLVQELVGSIEKEQLSRNDKASEQAHTFMRCSELLSRVDDEGSRRYFEKAVAAAEGVDEDAPHLLGALARAGFRASIALHSTRRREMAADLLRATTVLYPRFGEEPGTQWWRVVDAMACLDSATGFDAVMQFHNAGSLDLSDSVPCLMSGLSAGAQVAPAYVGGLNEFGSVSQRLVEATLDHLRLLNASHASLASSWLSALAATALRDLPYSERKESLGAIAGYAKSFRMSKPLIKELDEAILFYSSAENWSDASPSTAQRIHPDARRSAAFKRRLRRALGGRGERIEQIIVEMSSVSSALLDDALAELARDLRGGQRRVFLKALMDASSNEAMRFDYVLPRVIERALSEWREVVGVDSWVQPLMSSYLEGQLPRLLSYGVPYEHTAKGLIEHVVIGAERRASVLLPSLAKHASRFSAATVYDLAGAFAASLRPDDAAAVASRALERLSSALPAGGSTLVPVDGRGDGGLCKFLQSCFGHHDTRIRWRALHAARKMIGAIPEPLISDLGKASFTEEGRLWMSMREWLLFLFRHLSEAASDGMAAHCDVLKWHAFSDTFPHAGIRELAKQGLLQLERAGRGLLDAPAKESLALLNVPRSCSWSPDRNGGVHQTSGGQKGRFRFAFNSMDTLPYWYAPLSHCFGLHRCDVARRAESWICDRWRMTSDQCLQDDRSRLAAYEWGMRSNRHGSLPIIEELQTYLERHAMFMAAGEMVAELPAVRELGDESDAWAPWIRRNCFEADPCVTSDIRGAVPRCPEHHGILADDDVRGLPADLLNRQLQYEKEGEVWHVVAGEFTIRKRPATYSVSIESALVPPATAMALAVAMIAAEDVYAIRLPEIELSHEQFLSEVEECLAHRGRERREGMSVPDASQFQTRPWIVHFYSEHDAHSADPCWPRTSRSWHMLDDGVAHALHLSRERRAASYYNRDSTKVSFAEVWNESKGDNNGDEPSSSGDRLHVRRQEVLEYARCVGLDIVVRLHARRRYYSAKEYEKKGTAYDQTQVVIIRQGGRIERLAGNCRPRPDDS